MSNCIIAVGSSKIRAVASENRIVVPNTHESIISQKTYDDVQALLKQKSVVRQVNFLWQAWCATVDVNIRCLCQNRK